MKLSEEQSQVQAEIIKVIMLHLELLNGEYLQDALKELENHISFSKSAMVINPAPFTAIPLVEFNEALNTQLDLLLKLKAQGKVIQEKKKVLLESKHSEEILKGVFGL